MRRKSFLIFAILIIALLMGANLASAVDPIPVESGFSGFIRPGVGYHAVQKQYGGKFFRL